MKDLIVQFDQWFIPVLRRISMPMARFAIFVVYFWFGLLKVLALSPANPLVADLLDKTLPFISFNEFIILFGLFEMLIGLMFLAPGLERAAIALLMLHMVTTIMPLVLLPAITWSGFLVPTLEGQYIIKNLALIAIALGIGAQLTPFRRKK